ncbi:hypothetical protein EVAR_61945_1 [Eumeta japonica]|uniref:Uncharacterized protein n=1 Tax=Eumeta variegata TaxID=151549 RepID=A0A4C1ZP71_EUMVA|nr:hypothetical protein EVAR_61945_1 [Eumeta japonica]
MSKSNIWRGRPCGAARGAVVHAARSYARANQSVSISHARETVVCRENFKHCLTIDFARRTLSNVHERTGCGKSGGCSVGHHQEISQLGAHATPAAYSRLADVFKAITRTARAGGRVYFEPAAARRLIAVRSAPAVRIRLPEIVFLFGGV